jgi:transposase
VPATDAIDAQTLAQLASCLQPDLWTPPPTIYEELEQRLTQRDSLLVMRGQVRNQLHALQHNLVVVTSVRQRMEALDKTVTTQIGEIEAELTALSSSGEEEEASESSQLSTERAWVKNIGRLQTIPGIGLITANWIVVATMNFTRLSHCFASCRLCWTSSHATRIRQQCASTSLYWS